MDAGLTHVSHGCVGDEQLASAGTLFGDATRRTTKVAIDQAIFDEDRAAGNSGSAGDADSDQAGVDAVDIDVAQANGPSRVQRRVETVERDVDAVGPGVKDRSEHLVAIDGDRLGDGHRAETAGIEAVDLSVEGGFGNGAGEGLAWRGAAARIGIIPYPGHPGPQRLGVSGRALQEKRERRCDKRERSLTHGALRPDHAADGRRIRAATAYCRRQQLKRDLRALVPISQRRALRLHLESIRIPNGIRRIRKADNRHALVVGRDVAEPANAFESELVGRVRLGGHGDLRAGCPIAQPGHHNIAADQRRIDVGHVAAGTLGGVFANEENLLLVRILQALGNGLRQRSRADR